MADDADYFAEAKLRRAQLHEQLAAAPVVEVLGVVGPNGAGGGQLRGEDLWTLSFTLEVWRIDGAYFQTKPLAIQRMVTHEELKKFMGLINPYDVVRIKGRVILDLPFGGSCGLLEEFVGIDTSDAELNYQVLELQKPVTFEDPDLGTFTLDRRIGWYNGKIVWGGNLVTLSLEGSKVIEAQESVKVAHTLMENQALWEQRVRDYAVQELLPLKNGGWLDEGEAELTPEDFKNRMTLEAINVDPDGSFAFWHDDGDLFGGHAIEVRGSLSEGPNYADIPG